MLNRKTLLITKYIRKILVQNVPELQNRVYALDARVGTKFPFAAIERGNVTSSSYSKDGLVEDTVDFTIYLLSKDYDSGVELANNIRNLIDCSGYNEGDFHISRIELRSCSETYIDNNGGAFLQTLNFTAKI